MKRMKTFFMYFILLVGLFVVSNILENGLVNNMYSKISSSVNNNQYINGIYTEVEITENGSRATNVNGYINFSIKNNMNSDIEKCFLKLDLFNSRGLLAETEYIEVNGLKSGEKRDYQVKFKANNIERYEISLIDESQKPDESKVIRLLGWEMDLSRFENILQRFGIDPTNVFGLDLTALNWQKIKNGGISLWHYGINLAKSIPVWAYVIAAGIVVWNLPSGYLFFL